MPEMRTMLFAYREVERSEWEAIKASGDEEQLKKLWEEDLTAVAILGFRQVLKRGITEAIKVFNHAGVRVRALSCSY